MQNKNGFKWWSVLIWIVLWQCLNRFIDNQIIFSSPIEVIFRLFELTKTALFWNSILFSFSRIILGFTIATICGCLSAIASYRFSAVFDLLSPAILVIKSTPMASFVILCLMWLKTEQLAIFISFLMVFPIIYQNVYTGLCSVDSELLEMSKVFNLPLKYRIKYIYVSNLLPFFKSAVTVSLGLSWKSGIAAEIIGKPIGSIGENLYQSKIYMETSDVLAWTLTIIIISVLFEKIFLRLLDVIILSVERS